ncbi:MAG: methyltransferase domain-containing protein [Candidatus Acidiferrum sp.]|jgi:27-O-demethylrifamycin SV methyltransferase
MAPDADCLSDKVDVTAEVVAAGGSRSGDVSTEPGAHYDRVTEAWRYLIGDDLHVGYFKDASFGLREATLALSELMAETAGFRSGARVLDVGCGTGNPAIYLRSKYGCDVVGISNSPVGVRLAQEKAMRAGVEDRVKFQVEDGTATSFASKSFDCVWVMESSHLMPEKERLIKECARVLRKDGRVVLCDLVLRRAIPVSPTVTFLHDMMVLQEVYGKSELLLIESYVQQFRACGLRAEGRDISEEVLPTFARWRENGERHAVRVGEILGEAHLRRFMRSCDIMTRLFEDGQLGYCIVSAGKPV